VKPGDEGVGDFLTAHPDFEGISVKVVGVFTDAEGAAHEFTFTSRMNVVSAINFDEPVTVGAGTTNLTIDVDVGSWFTGAAGAVIDPTNPANQRAIEQNIPDRCARSRTTIMTATRMGRRPADGLS
jgi:hypothetical protein